VSAAIACSDPRATAAGADVLRGGGTAIDAAVAAALVLFVVEPQSCGPGGDGFLIHVGSDGSVVAVDGSGALPLGLTDEALAERGLDAVPPRGAITATVPGALSLFEYGVARFGSRSLADLAGPAIVMATEGFEVRPTLAVAAARAVGEIGGDPVLGPLYVPDGVPVTEGQIVRNPALASLLVQVSSEGSAALHAGSLGSALVARLAAGGGVLSMEDLAAHSPVPVSPVSAEFRGSTVWELPAPTQGPAVTSALAALERGAVGADDLHGTIEAVRAGMVSAGFDVSTIGQRPPTPAPAKGDTTYIAAIDSYGNGASLITSVFGDFGSHFGVPELGGPIGNRATMMRALRRPLTPGKRPPHTTIPAAVTRDGRLQYVIGVAGGFMQPQAQVQVLVNLLARGMAPQAAIDAPRFKIVLGGGVSLEAGHAGCAAWPDAAARPAGPEGYGACQVAGWRADGVLDAGADPRRGGMALVLAGAENDERRQP
jgi:gamma-glutamyltranspeptidase/glutathione hydrolase